MTTRQYAQKAIFERSRSNARELERLLNKLTFRNTVRAWTLKTKIGQALTELSGRGVASMLDSSPSARHPCSGSTQSSQVMPRDAPTT